MLLGQSKISLQGQGAPRWQQPSIPAATRNAASHGRQERRSIQPSPPLGEGLEGQCSSPYNKFQKQNSYA